MENVEGDDTEASGGGEDDGEEAVKVKQTTVTAEKQNGNSKNQAKAEETLLEDTVRLSKLLDDEKRRSEDYLNRLKYAQADFENYRRRIDREIQGIEDFSTTRLVRNFLPVLDALDSAVASDGGNEKDSAVLEGLKMVQKTLLSVLEGEGLKRIEAVGKPFDPELHEAVEKVQRNASQAGDIVVEEVRSGFTFKGKVLRPSMVKVAMSSDMGSDRKEVSGA